MRVLFATDILSFLATASTASGGLVDISDYQVADVVRASAPHAVQQIGIEATTADVSSRFFPAKAVKAERPRVLIVIKAGEIVGCIVHPEMNYTASM